MIVLSRSKGTERLQDLCLNWYKQTNSLRMASLVCKGRHCGSPEIQHQLLSATSQDPTWKITFSENISKQLHCVVSYSRPPSVTLQSIAAKAGKMSTRFLLYFALSMSQCQTVNIHNVKMPQCHNIHNVTIFPISQCHTIHNISMSQGQNTSQCLNVTMSHYSQYLDVTMSNQLTWPPTLPWRSQLLKWPVVATLLKLVTSLQA